jgi:site-specific DNA-methyltransferase (adenine-specific)
MISEVYNEDCLINLACYPAGFFDLGIVDPPYGIDASNMKLGEGGGLYRAPKTYKRGDWDKQPPGPEYFRELFRVCRDVIIFGANHFISRLPADRQDASCWVVWDKNNGETSFADVELAWTSFDCPARLVKFTWSGFIQGRMGDEKEDKIHPTQKPVYLYRWLLNKFAVSKDGVITHRKILDTHMGSQSSRIAAHLLGLDYYGWEIDADYFAEGNKRYAQETAQQSLFNF